MCDYYPYWKKKRNENSSVGQSLVRQLTVKKSVRFINENYDDVSEIMKFTGQDYSKVINDILSDFFLTRERERMKQELEGI